MQAGCILGAAFRGPPIFPKAFLDIYDGIADVKEILVKYRILLSGDLVQTQECENTRVCGGNTDAASSMLKTKCPQKERTMITLAETAL